MYKSAFHTVMNLKKSKGVCYCHPTRVVSVYDSLFRANLVYESFGNETRWRMEPVSSLVPQTYSSGAMHRPQLECAKFKLSMEPVRV